MRIFLIRLFQFFCIPIIFLIVIAFFYIKRDPYLDFGRYKNYSWKYQFQMLGDISTKKLLNSSTHYDSFIFGSSRARSLYACYLQKKVSNSQFFHYANWAETVGGIYAKLKLLDSRGYKINNVFIYFDTDYTFANNGLCKNDHYLLTKENKFIYYFKHYKNFIPPLLDYDKLKILMGYKVTGDIFPNWSSDTITNDGRHICSDSIINTYGNTGFTKNYMDQIDSLKKSGFLYTRSKSQKFKEKQISPSEEVILMKIKQILQKHNSNYFVVITPLYDQLKFNISDMQIIKKIFDNNVYDFSGINKTTNNEYNYPDRKHFAPYISKMIADSVIAYRQKKMTFDF